ncbi:MAG: hypothetical protein KGQ42_03410 [Alphaproteobacteria bacterium]|nr:hypothetical protein [Alphaproteobacteria bacterium]MDE2341480.1 hypothetical protein [Alphaproteobacteria bacterium]
MMTDPRHARQSAKAMRDATRDRLAQSVQDFRAAVSPATLRARGQSAVQHRVARALTRSQILAKRNGRTLGLLIIGVAALSAARPLWKNRRKPAPRSGDES